MGVQACHQKKDRQSFPQENLESACKNTDILGICYLVDGNQHPFFMFLYASEHPNQRFLNICDRRPFDSDFKAKGLQIDLRFLKKTVENLITGQLCGQSGQQFPLRIQVDNDPLLLLLQLAGNPGNEHGLSASSDSCHQVQIVSRALLAELTDDPFCLSPSFNHFKRRLTKDQRIRV